MLKIGTIPIIIIFPSPSCKSIVSGNYDFRYKHYKYIFLNKRVTLFELPWDKLLIFQNVVHLKISKAVWYETNSSH